MRSLYREVDIIVFMNILTPYNQNPLYVSKALLLVLYELGRLFYVSNGVIFLTRVVTFWAIVIYALDIFLNGRLHGKWHYVLVNWVEFICLYRSPLMRSFGHFFTTLHSIEMVIQYSRDFQSKNIIFYDIMKQNISWFHISTCIKEFVIGKTFKRQ